MNKATYERIINTLDALYGAAGVPLYERGGIQYPLCLQPISGIQPDALLGAAPGKHIRQDELAFYDDSIIQEIQESGGTLYDATTFAFDALATDPPRLHARLGTYYNHMSTCVALERELLAGGPSPLRDALHREIAPSDIMRSGAGRSAAMGVNTLVVYQATDGTYRALLAQRSEKTAHKPGALHVVPAFTFQPVGTTDATRAWSLSGGIQREYAEELFGEEEAEHGGTGESAALHVLDTMLADGRATLELTGMTINLMTTHVSVCTLLLVHDPAWFPALETTLAHTWETRRVYSVPIASDEALLDALPPDAYLNTAPNGTSSLWLGVDRARNHLMEKTS